MSKVITNAKIYTGETVLEKGYIRFDEKVNVVDSMDHYEEKEDEQVIDGTGKTIIPGFIEVHSHGGYGSDTMDADPEVINEMAKKMLREGITSYFPTTMTKSDENIEKALAGIKEAKKTQTIMTQRDENIEKDLA